jgi:hypothetical protein
MRWREKSGKEETYLHANHAIRASFALDAG